MRGKKPQAERWGLLEARVAAAMVLAARHPVREARLLVDQVCGGDDFERQSAADTARRLSETDQGLALLAPHANALVSAAMVALAENAEPNWRTRGHMMLLAARVCRTQQQRQVLADVLMEHAEDKRIVLRANALEALVTLSQQDAEMQAMVEPMLQRALRAASAAERCRARDGLAKLCQGPA